MVHNLIAWAMTLESTNRMTCLLLSQLGKLPSNLWTLVSQSTAFVAASINRSSFKNEYA
jgi:hypothetical protein